MPVVDEVHTILLHLKSATLVPPTGLESASSPSGHKRRLHGRRARAVLAHMPDCRPGPDGVLQTLNWSMPCAVAAVLGRDLIEQSMFSGGELHNY